MAAPQLQAALDLLGKDAKNIAVYARQTVKVAKALPQRRMPELAADCAQELFAVLRDLDATGVRLIWVEAPPEGADWDGVRDRLVRAAA
jgi:L-threonylcarbamoyladenylate synthase